jgi:hypothetical protein
MSPHKKDVVINLPKGYDSKKRIEKNYWTKTQRERE